MLREERQCPEDGRFVYCPEFCLEVSERSRAAHGLHRAEDEQAQGRGADIALAELF